MDQARTWPVSKGTSSRRGDVARDGGMHGDTMQDEVTVPYPSQSRQAAHPSCLSATLAVAVGEKPPADSILYEPLAIGRCIRVDPLSSPQASMRTKPGNFGVGPWPKLIKMASLTSLAVLLRCAGVKRACSAGGRVVVENSSVLPLILDRGAIGVVVPGRSNARRAMVCSSSARQSGFSSPRGASSDWANQRASAILPWRINSMSRCCWR
jgi:hypothetical protein